MGGRLCVGCLNLALATVALVLAIVAGSLLVIDAVPIPSWIVRQVEARVEQADVGLSFDWRSLSSTLRGDIVLEDLVVRDRRNGQVVLRCDKAIGKVGVFTRLLGGPLALHSLELENAVLFTPPETSPETGKALVQIIALRLHLSPHEITLERALGRIGDTRISVTGSLPADSDLAPEAKEPAARWRPAWIAASELLLEARRQLAAATDASLTATIARTAKGGIEVSAEAIAESFRTTGGLRAEGVYLHVPSVRLPQKVLPEPLTLRAARISEEPGKDGAGFTVHRLRAFFLKPSAGLAGWSLPGELHAFARVETGRFPEVHLFARTSLLPLPEVVQVSGRAQSAGLSLDWSGKVDRLEKSVDLSYALRGNPDRLLAHPELGAAVAKRITDFSDAFTLAGTAHWSAFTTFDHADFSVRARDFWTKETHYDEARARFQLTPQRLVADPIEVFDPGGQHAHGAYLHAFPSHRFRILGQGEILPRRIDSLLPSFYRELWERIDPGEHPAFGDVDVSGLWGEGSETTTFLRASGRNATYNDQPVDRFSLRLRQASGFVELMDLQAASPGGHRLEGSLAFLFPRNDSQPRRTLLKLDSHLPLPILAGVLGSEAEAVNQRLDLTAPPFVRLKGAIASFADEHTERDLRVEASARSPLTAYGVPFEWLETHARINDRGFVLSPLNFGLAGGQAKAEAEVAMPRDQDPAIHLRADLRGAEYTTAERLLGRLLADGRPPAEDAEAIDAVSPEERGDLDLSLHIRGVPGRWDLYHGQGRLEIHEAPLGRIELFGGLSRLFGSIGLNLATFHLEDLSSELLFTPGKIGFPDLEIRGPNLKIEGQGEVAVPSAALDFDAKVFFLDTEDPSLRSFFGALLRPIGHALEVSVTGVPEEPEWSFKRNPLNLLKPAEPPAPSTTTPAPEELEQP